MHVDLKPATIKALHSEYGSFALQRSSLEEFVNAMAVEWVRRARTARRIIEENTLVELEVAETS